ncbi:MAG: hypothetical protein ACOYT4_00455 [Nanoarchaeota archaeon]
MERKLIKQGIGGLTFYVPNKWVKERNLKAGDMINVEETEDKLILSSKKLQKKQEIEIKIESESKEFIRNYLNQLYRLGFDKIKIESNNSEKLLLCQKFSQMFLLGFEVTEIKKNFCIIENVSEPSDEKQPMILRRIFLLIENSFELLKNDLAKNKPENQKEINRNTKKVTQYDNFLKRNLAKNNLAFGKEFFNWEICNFLLLIQHSFFHIYEDCNLAKNEKILYDFILQIEKNFQGIYEAFYKKDFQGLDGFQKQANDILIKIQKSKLKEINFFHYICELSRLQYLLCSPIISSFLTIKN